MLTEKQIQALARKNAAKAVAQQKKARPSYDATLDATRPSDAPTGSDADRIFKEMKKREF